MSFSLTSGGHRPGAGHIVGQAEQHADFDVLDHLTDLLLMIRAGHSFNLLSNMVRRIRNLGDSAPNMTGISVATVAKLGKRTIGWL
ncbi:hypothetical protein FHR94_002178 [Halomonas cerina]|uniref:Uncharacterized protein n=1 Tax=Halomonas cerina TaxID=447424 RepID=A0A839VE31_9GAMM|nr:hypothetical protein [Halomonas cerina]